MIKLNEGETIIITFYCSSSPHYICLNPWTVEDIQFKFAIVHSNDLFYQTNVLQMGCAQIPITWSRIAQLEEGCYNTGIACVQIYFSTTHSDVVPIRIHWDVWPSLLRWWINEGLDIFFNVCSTSDVLLYCSGKPPCEWLL